MEYLKLFLSILLMLISGQDTEYMVSNVVDVQQIVEISPYKVLLVDEGEILELNVITRIVKSIAKRDGNEFVGYDDGLMFCKIEHSIIDSEDDFSTRFTILNDERSIEKELEFFETIRPLYIDRKIVIATTAVDFLEKHFYKIDIESGDMEEVFLEDIEKRMSTSIVSEDVFGNVWVSYSTRDMAKIIIATLKLNLKIILNIIPMNVPKPAFTP